MSQCTIEERRILYLQFLGTSKDCGNSRGGKALDSGDEGIGGLNILRREGDKPDIVQNSFQKNFEDRIEAERIALCREVGEKSSGPQRSACNPLYTKMLSQYPRFTLR